MKSSKTLKRFLVFFLILLVVTSFSLFQEFFRDADVFPEYSLIGEEEVPAPQELSPDDFLVVEVIQCYSAEGVSEVDEEYYSLPANFEVTSTSGNSIMTTGYLCPEGDCTLNQLEYLDVEIIQCTNGQCMICEGAIIKK